MGAGRMSLTRRVRSASDCRLSGCWVCATVSHAIAVAKARSSGGKSGLSATSFTVVDRQLPGQPALPPAPHLPSREPHLSTGCFVVDVGLLLKQKHQPKALHVLPTGSALTNRQPCLLQKVPRKSTRLRRGSRHRRPPCASISSILSSSITELRRNPDVICETDHLAFGSVTAPPVFVRPIELSAPSPAWTDHPAERVAAGGRVRLASRYPEL